MKSFQLLVLGLSMLLLGSGCQHAASPFAGNAAEVLFLFEKFESRGRTGLALRPIL